MVTASPQGVPQNQRRRSDSPTLARAHFWGLASTSGPIGGRGWVGGGVSGSATSGAACVLLPRALASTARERLTLFGCALDRVFRARFSSRFGDGDGDAVAGYQEHRKRCNRGAVPSPPNLPGCRVPCSGAGDGGCFTYDGSYEGDDDASYDRNRVDPLAQCLSSEEAADEEYGDQGGVGRAGELFVHDRGVSHGVVAPW